MHKIEVGMQGVQLVGQYKIRVVAGYHLI